MSQRHFKIPYYGAMAMLRPTNGEYVAALSELTGEYALKRLHQRLLRTPKGQGMQLTDFSIHAYVGVLIRAITTETSDNHSKHPL